MYFFLLQSGFRTHHSTKTALNKVVKDAKQLSVVLLDLSAAFNTIDPDVLLDRLVKWVCLSSPYLNWFNTYLT
jgi:hypothetical protein